MSGYQVLGWAEETELGNDDDRRDVWFLTIADREGEELATVIHRTCAGRYPIDGDAANQKVNLANWIVDCMNNAKGEPAGENFTADGVRP